jgi:YggT family protein
VIANFGLLFNVADKVRQFIDVFIVIYGLLIFVYVLSSWFRLPYSRWLSRIQRFLYDTCEPYLRIFRRILPAFGPLDLSPWFAVAFLYVVKVVLDNLLGRLS